MAALATTNAKQAALSWCQVWEPAIPMVNTGFPTAILQQQLLWGMPSPAWAAPVSEVPTGHMLWTAIFRPGGR